MATIADRVINSEKEFNDVFSNFYMTDSDFRKLICDEVISQGGHITVNNNIDPKMQRWDGLFTIHFLTAPTSQEVVKIIKAASLPNDFGMNDDKTLWFWWD